MLDQIDVPFVLALNIEWRVAPPPRLLAAARAGYKPPMRRKAGSLRGDFPDGVIR